MKNKIIDDYMSYANAVIKSRAVPYVEDNLKPVLRRILYSMGMSKLKSSGRTVKSAKVVGEVMGRLHPHGDASIYDAMVRMAQPWKMRYPLVVVQGNMGSLNGDSPAASRYTEAKLSLAGEYMLKNLGENIVPYVPTYNNDEKEPVILPSIFPNILCNGVDGIAVGMSTNILPHNIVEVANLLKTYISNPRLTIDEALQIMPGPDFPLGGNVIDGYKLREIYSTGRGTITLRAQYEIDRVHNVIQFSQFPYLVDVETRIIKAIKELSAEGLEIEDVNNHIGKGDCYINVVLAKKANPDKIVQILFDKTPLQKTVKVNQTVIVDQAIPMSMNLFGILRYYIKHQHNCIKNMAIQESEKLQHTIHITKGLIAATLDIDNVIAIIRSSDNTQVAKVQLMKLLSVDEEQASAILEIKLARLTKLDTNDLLIKREKAEEGLKVQQDIIANQKTRENIICKNLDEMVRLFGDSRRTTIVTASPSETIELEEDKVLLYSKGELEVLNESAASGKTIKEVSRIIVTDKPFRHLSESGDTTDEYENSVGILEMETDKEFLLTISANGVIKKTATSEYKNFKKLCKLKKDDTLKYACFVNSGEKVLILSEDKVTPVLVDDIKTSGKLTIGSKMANSVERMCVGKDTDHFYTMNNIGQIKRSSFKEIGTSALSLNKDIVEFGKCGNMYYVDGKVLTQVDWNKIGIKGRTSIGAKLTNKTSMFFGETKICK